MARKRMISPSFWSDEKLGQCSVQERLLFMGLVSNADDEGYGRANPKLLRSSIFPYDDLRASDLEKWLSRLGGLNLIVLYEVEGQAYYYLPNFSKHQTINRPTPSIFPAIPVVPYGDAQIAVSAHGRLSEDSLLREEKRKEKEYAHLPKGKMSEHALFDQWFSAFWEQYPKKVGKKNAEKAFLKALKAKVDPTDILAGLQRFLGWCRRTGQEKQFIPYPATWLNGERWQDELTDPVNGNQETKQGQDIAALYRKALEQGEVSPDELF